jgi:hypothetical protein
MISTNLESFQFLHDAFKMWAYFRISKNFREGLMLALSARILRSLKLDIANNLFHIACGVFQGNINDTIARIIFR